MSEMFLAEAAVAVVPDLTAFRTKLIADLKVATSGVVANVKVAAQGATTAAAAATTAGRGAAQSTGTVQQSAAAGARAHEQSLRHLASAENVIALAEKKVLTITDAVTVARKRLDATMRASAFTAKAVAAADRSTVEGTAEAAQKAHVLALAREEQARATLLAAQAEKTLAGQQVSAASTADTTRDKALGKLASAEAVVAAAEKKVATTASAAAAASLELTAARRALVLTTEALALAEASTIAPAIEAARTAQGLAITRERQALTAYEAATAEKTLAATEARTTAETARAAAASAARSTAAGKGFVTTGLAAAGLRGAVLSANAAFLGGAVAAVAFGKAVGSAAALESELNVFAVTAGATAEQMERVSAEAQALGRDITLPGVTAGDAAGAFTELAKAGLSVEDSLAGAKGVLQLATAAQIDNSQATIIAASALNAFGLSGDKAVHVADLLANAANASQGSISDMGLSLQQAAAVSRQVGVSLEDTVALLTLLAKNGIRGSDAGTSLRVSFTKLINPTAKAAEVLNKLNVNVRDAAGNVRPEVFNDFAAAQADLTRAEQDRNAGIVFGTDALRAYSIISREALGGLDATRSQLDRQGSAAELAGARMAGLAGASENLKNQLAALGTTVGTVLIPPLTAVADVLAGAFSGINVGLGGIGKGVSAALDALNGQNLDLDPAAGSVRDLTERLREVSDEATEFKSKNEGRFIPPSFASETKKLTAELLALSKVVEATGSSQAMQSFLTQFMNASPQIAKAFIDGIITPAEKAELATTSLGRAFLKVVPDDVFSGLGAAARDGVEYARTVAGRGIDNMGAHVRSKIEDMSRTAGTEAASAGKNVGDKFVEALASAASRSKLDLALAQAGGDENAEVSILRKREQRQEEFLEKVLRRPKTPKNVALATEAAGNLDQTRSAVAAIVDRRAADEKAASDKIAVDAKAAADKRVSDAKAAATKLRTAREKADREVVDAIGDRSAAFDTRKTEVQATPGLQDDINLARNRKRFLTKQIEIAEDSIKDDKLRRDTIKDLARQRRLLTTEIDVLVDDQRKAAVLKAQERRNTITDNLGKLLQIAELRGSKDAILAALTRAIIDSRRRVAAAKKAGKGVLDEKIALETLLGQRRELLKDAKKGADEAKEQGQGITAFDLLTQFSGIFGDTAGNLIGGSQPFQTAGGINGFTADIASHLRRTGAGGKTLGGLAGKTKAERNILKLDDTAIVSAMNGLKDAFLGRSGPGTGEVPRRQSPGSGAVERNDNRWREAGRARSAVEQRRSGI